MNTSLVKLILQMPVYQMHWCTSSSGYLMLSWGLINRSGDCQTSIDVITFWWMAFNLLWLTCAASFVTVFLPDTQIQQAALSSDPNEFLNKYTEEQSLSSKQMIKGKTEINVCCHQNQMSLFISIMFGLLFQKDIETFLHVFIFSRTDHCNGVFVDFSKKQS